MPWKNDAIIFFDAAYEAFITTPGIPHSIYEIEGAKKCAIEFRSFSKTAGFTGVRCGLVVIPEEVTGAKANGERYSMNKLWLRRMTTKFNGTSLPGSKSRLLPSTQKKAGSKPKKLSTTT